MIGIRRLRWLGTCRRHAACLVTWLVGVLTVLTMAGCGDDDETKAVIPLGPPSLSVVFPSDGACVMFHDDEVPAVRVRIEAQNWLLRPIGYCGETYSQCGHAVFFVDGNEMIRSASLVTDVPFEKLSSPTGKHHLRVELRNDDDVVVLDRMKEPLEAEVSIEAVEAGQACP